MSRLTGQLSVWATCPCYHFVLLAQLRLCYLAAKVANFAALTMVCSARTTCPRERVNFNNSNEQRVIKNTNELANIYKGIEQFVDLPNDKDFKEYF